MNLQEVQEAAQAAAEAVERLMRLTQALSFTARDGKAECHIRLSDLTQLTTELEKKDRGYAEKCPFELSAEIGGVKLFALATAEQLYQLEKANKKAAL